MITIAFDSFWFEQTDKKEACINFVEEIVGPSEKIIISKEEENDPESSFSIFLIYSNHSIEKFEYYDELMDFSRENELYVTLYDHDTKHSKSYQYDEDENWFIEDMEIYGFNRFDSIN
jgi:hypothetical protein